MKCTGRRTNGQPCTQHAVRGTDRCTKHAGIAKADHMARGAVVLELRSWGLDDELVDSTQAMLRLLAQSYRRAQRYSDLLADAYEAAERLRAATNPPTADDVPRVASNHVDRERAAEDLDRIFTTGGVAALVGYKYGAAGKDGNLYVAEEAMRGLQRLEAEERDRAFRFAKECRAAGLDERLVRLAEQQGTLVAGVITAVLADLGIDVGAPDVVQVVSTRLRALDGAA